MTFDANEILTGENNTPKTVIVSNDGYKVVVHPESYSVSVNTSGVQGADGKQGPQGIQGPPGEPGGSPNYLYRLLDVDLSTLNQDKEYYFKYDPNNHKWINNEVYNGGSF